MSAGTREPPLTAARDRCSVTTRRSTLAGGLALFLGAMVAAIRRTEGRWLGSRTALTAGTAAGVVAIPGAAAVTLALALTGVATIAAIEHRLVTPSPEPPAPGPGFEPRAAE